MTARNVAVATLLPPLHFLNIERFDFLFPGFARPRFRFAKTFERKICYKLIVLPQNDPGHREVAEHFAAFTDDRLPIMRLQFLVFRKRRNYPCPTAAADRTNNQWAVYRSALIW